MQRSLRVISLLPSATEIVCALDATDLLVGISHECDYPDAIRHRQVLTRSRMDPSGSSREIDEAVRTALVEALSVYEVDEVGLAELEPDVVVTQDLCEVCAVSLDDVKTAVARLAHREHVRVVSLRPTRLADVLSDVDRVAAALERESLGARLRSSLESRIDKIAERAAWATERPRVASVEWIEPIMLGGTWMPELIELAGGTPVGVSAGEPSPTIDSQALADLEPDVVLIKPCGFSLERALEERDVIAKSISAVLGGETSVVVTDGNAFFNRPGPRLVESLEILAATVHPELFPDFRQKHADVVENLDPS